MNSEQDPWDFSTQGVTTLFGYPGAAVLPNNDELIPPGQAHPDRHEQAAAHAPTDKPVPRKTAYALQLRPRACNLEYRESLAYMDSIPFVAKTARSDSFIGNDASRTDITGITSPSPSTNLVKRTEVWLAQFGKRSISQARRKGPVLIVSQRLSVK